jgi:hypothetical protein
MARLTRHAIFVGKLGSSFTFFGNIGGVTLKTQRIVLRLGDTEMRSDLLRIVF